ncbi:MAG TPA: hypothetical protein VNA20_11725 [Frankiaceae bacterium]|nr:hypothetical protein [Frankiaceae bacterium]
MPNARRRLAVLPAAFLLAAGLAHVPATAGSGPVVIDAHDSHIPTAAYEISSSTGGTVYSADVGGFGRYYLAPAAMAVGSPTIDLGPRGYNRVGATISGTRVAFPHAPSYGSDTYSSPVTSVRSCPIGTCPTMTTLTVPAGHVYVGNAGDAAILYSSATDQLRLSSWTGTLGVSYDLPFHYDEPPVAHADATGIVLSGNGNVTFVNRVANTVTDLDYGDGGYLTPSYVVWHAVGVGPEAGPWSTKVYRVLRSNPGIVGTVVDLADAPGIEDLAANDTGVAWTIPNGDEDGSQALWTMPYDGTPALYARRLLNSGLSTFEGTAQVLVNDRLAGIPGFYKVTPGAYSGSLTGILPVRPSITRSLAVSTGRAIYTDDTTHDHPAYIRDVTNATPGPESSVTHAAESVGLSGPYVAFTRPSTTEGSTDVFYGRTGTTLARVTYPMSQVAKVSVSGSRVLVNGATTRVIDAATGSVTSLGSVFAAIFGDHVATISPATGAVQRRNLVTGAVQTVRAAVAGCTSSTSCVDDDGWHLSMWGAEVVYAFGHGGTTPGFASGFFDGLTAGTTALPMLYHLGDPSVWALTYWDGHLLVSHSHDVNLHLYDLRAGGDVLVDSFAEAPFGLDGNVVAWRPDTDLRAVVRDVRDFYPGYAPEPRLLGGTLPAGFGPGAPVPLWKPSLLLSQDTTGAVDIHSGSATGPVVRSLPFTSVRGEVTPTWDGRDGSGVLLPQGTYYWTLSRPGAGPIPIENSAGSAGASGPVYLSTAAPGAPGLTAPARSTDVTAGTSFPVRWALPGAPAGTMYRLSRSTNGGAFATVTTTSATAYTATGAPGSTYRFRVQAIDPAGRVGAASATRTTMVPHDAGGTVSGTWTTAPGASYYRGSQRRASTAGATWSFTGTGTQIQLIGTKAASYGQLQVSIDGGAYAAATDTYSASTRYRQVLYTRSGLAAGPHTIKVRVVGTGGRPYVGIDAVAYLR